MKSLATVGLYRTRQEVEQATEALKRNGFTGAHLHTLLPNESGTRDISHEKHTKAAEGAVTGGILGVVLGGVLGWMMGMGTLAVPALNSLVTVGPIVSALAGAGALGILFGLVGALIGVGMPEFQVKFYQGRTKRAGILLSAHCENEAACKKAREVFHASGAESVTVVNQVRADSAPAERPIARPQSVV